MVRDDLAASRKPGTEWHFVPKPIFSGNHSFPRALPSVAAASLVKGFQVTVPTADVGLHSVALFLGISQEIRPGVGKL